MDGTLLPTMAPSPTLSSFTDSFKEKDSSHTTRSQSVRIKFPVRVVGRVANSFTGIRQGAPPPGFRDHPFPTLNFPGRALLSIFTGIGIVATDAGGFGLDGQGPALLFPKRNMATGACRRRFIGFRCLETRMVGTG